MAYAIKLTPAAEKDLAGFPESLRLRLWQGIETIAENPRQPGTKKMEGQKNLYRFRVGSYRILYAIHDQELLVLVTTVAERGKVYSLSKRRR